jgi:hypothetical protein
LEVTRRPALQHAFYKSSKEKSHLSLLSWHRTIMATRVAFVSGAARGMGRVIAWKLANDGFDVAINDIATSLGGLEETASIIASAGE